MSPTTALPALTLGALALTALTLSACGAEPSTPSVAPPASSAPAPSATENAPSARPSTAAAEVKDACTVLDADAVEDLTGVEVKKGTTQSVGSSTICTWSPANPGKSDAAVISAQEGPLPGPLSQVEGQLKSQFGGTVSKLTVPGADDARYVTGKRSGLNVIDVLAQKDDIFYQVLVATPRDAAQHKAGAVKVAEALLRG